MRALVTGAAGFIGNALTRGLLARGDEVVGVDDLNDYYDVRLKRDRIALCGDDPAFSLRELDVADARAMATLDGDGPFDVVVHLAAQAGVRYSIENPGAFVRSNLVGFANVLELMAHSYAHNFGMPCTGLRFSVCTGRGVAPTWRCSRSRVASSTARPSRSTTKGA